MTSPETNQEDTKKAKMMQKRLGNQYLEKESCRQVTHAQTQHALGEAVPGEDKEITNWYKVIP